MTMPATWVHWAEADEKTLRRCYPALGAAAVAVMLSRSAGAVKWRAGLLKVKTTFRGPRARKTAEEHRATRRAWHARKGGADKAAKRAAFIAVGRCRCGAETKPRRRMCERCLTHAKRWYYWHRYGVRPTRMCSFCKKRWAAPGSKVCQRDARREGRS